MKRLPFLTAVALAFAATTAYAQDPPPGPAGAQPGNPADPAVQPQAQQVIPSDEAATLPLSDPSGPTAAAAGDSPAQSTHLASALPQGPSTREACAGFKSELECATTVHAAENLSISFADLKSKVAGGQTLAAAIHELKPPADAKGEVRRAEDLAHADLGMRTRPEG
jgi:hypothetical protein